MFVSSARKLRGLVGEGAVRFEVRAFALYPCSAARWCILESVMYTGGVRVRSSSAYVWNALGLMACSTLQGASVDGVGGSAGVRTYCMAAICLPGTCVQPVLCAGVSGLSPCQRTTASVSEPL